MPGYENQMQHNNLLQQALSGVKKAVQGEREDELFYDYLISSAPDKAQQDIIASIRDDERRHNLYFRKIYKDFTGMDIPAATDEGFEKPESYIAGIVKALFGELSAVERYRAIRERLPEGPYRDVLFDIITDEIKHASKYNYLFTLNSTSAVAAPTNFTPDDWVRYITPLVNEALAETKEGINTEHLFQEYILSGVLVGLGKAPADAIKQVEQWEKTGESQLLVKSKMNRKRN